MRNVSKQFRDELNNPNRHLQCWVDIEFQDGMEMNLTEKNLMQEDGFKIDDATSNTGSFDVGSVICNQLTLKLNNADDLYSTCDFTGASVRAYTGMKLADGTTEKINMGNYTVDESQAVGITIVLKCLDNIHLLDQPYSKSNLHYPATLMQIARDACETCGLNLNTTLFDNYDYLIEQRPNDEAATCREVLSWVAQIACKYVRCDPYGRIFFSWYEERNYTEGYTLENEQGKQINTESMEEIYIFAPPSLNPDNIDGGVFDRGDPYFTGQYVDGGKFNPWEDTSTYDAGKFDTMRTYHHVYDMFSLSVGTDEIQITGVSVIPENEDSTQQEPVLYGRTGYVLSMEKNGLIQSRKQAEEAAVFIGEKLNGMTFRTFSASHRSDPTIEAGDTAYVTDRKQNSYKTYVTNTVFTACSSQKSSCDAEAPARKESTRFTEVTKALVKSRENTKLQISSYDKAVQALTSLITQSFGVYKTEEKLDDGSTIFYMYNKPTLGESDTIWKMTANAFAVSTDGGKTWNAGMDSQGNAVVNALSAIGIRFDWARGGTLTLGGDNNTSGVMQVLDDSGKVVCTINNKGADIVGKIISRNSNDGFSAVVDDGKLTLTDISGKKILQLYLAEEIDMSSGSRHWYAVIQGVGNKAATIRLDGENGEICLDTPTLKVGTIAGKSGKAEFSDGSYLTFSKGLLTGGKTSSGTTF